MRALLAIRLPKMLVTAQRLKSGKMPKSAFPLTHSHAYTLGQSWQWATYDLQSGKMKFLLLVAFDMAKQQYRGWLGWRDGRQIALLARLEYHPGHHFWHCHYRIGQLKDVARGVVKDSAAHESVYCCDVEPKFDISESNAPGPAFRVFCVTGGSADFQQ